ncbi:MAG: MotA/TolQ/ExbB proton channel family protein [Spirochaetaceae bacterium]|jgi:biopolymer transport protein ExbB|nr:MotA/TolQ/ExbB proton channel family protein [Spirochaetaceae bacterium]
MDRFLPALRFINSGGPVNWVIAALYVAVLAIFSGKAVYFFRTRYGKARLFELLEGPEPPADASSRSFSRDRRGCQPGRMAACFFERRDEPAPVLSEILDRQALVIRREMEKGLEILSFAGTVAPLLGLLGTITGLMSAFSAIEERGSAVDIAFLSGGIREAMITTATGLLTAIFALGCCKWFESLIASRLRDMGLAVSFLSEKFRQDILRGGSDGAERIDRDKESA